MNEKIFTKNDVINIINEELVRFHENVNNSTIVENFANEFSTVFIEALDIKDYKIRNNVMKDMTSFIKKYKNLIIESTVDPSFMSNTEYIHIISNNKDRSIYKLIEQSINLIKESNTDILSLEGDMFYGKESKNINISSYRGKEVILNTPFIGKTKKYRIYTECNNSIMCVEFGDDNMSIKKSNPSLSEMIWVCRKW